MIIKLWIFFIILLFVVLGMLGNCSTTELYTHTLSTFYFEIGFHFVAQAGLEFVIFLF